MNSSSTMDDLQKLKVVQLRAELTARGLDTKGVKAMLVERLLAAMNGGEEGVAVSVSVGNGSELTNNSSEIDEDGSEDISTAEVASPKRATRSGASENDSVNNKPVASSPAKVIPTPATTESPAKVDSPLIASTPVQEKPTPTVPKPVVASPTTGGSSTQPAATSPVKANLSPAKPAVTPEKTTTPEKAAVLSTDNSNAVTTPTKTPEIAPNSKPEAQSIPSQNVVESTKTEGSDDVEMKEENEAETPMETDTTQASNDIEAESGKRRIEAVNGDAESADNPEAKKAKTEEPVIKIIPENEPEFKESEVLLDWYKSDLNLKISAENFLQAEPIVYDDFPFAYAGAKATYGFTAGELCYEAKWTGTCEVKPDFGENEAKHVFRVGWSDLHTNLQLGEEKFSFGFDSSGKFYNQGEVQDLGEPLVEGDVITAYLNLDSDPIEIKFSKNGTALGGEAIQIPKSDVEDKTWFPHMLVRNVKFEANFGESEPAFPALDGYDFVSKAEESESRVRGPVRPEKKEECDFVMLVGMAGCGKTKWTKEYVKSNLDKHYNILGTSTLVERAVKSTTTVTGPNLPKVFEAFLSKAGKFVERMVDLAPSRRRNYILDQSNVVPNVQRRKCGGFEGFRRRAVVILPPDEEYQKRIKSKEQEQGKSVPKSTILEMKATLRLPEEGELFNSVEFPEMTKEEAVELVTKYNKEGLSAGYGRPPTARGGARGSFRGRGGSQRGGRGFQRGPGGGWPRRGGPGGGMRGFGGNMRRGGPPGPIMRIPRGPPVQGGGGPPRGRGLPMRGMRGGGGPPRGMPQPRGGTWARGGGGGGRGGDRGGGQGGFSRPGFQGQRGRGGGPRGGSGGPSQGPNSGNRWRQSGPPGFGGPGGNNNRAAQGGFPNWGQQNWGGRNSGGNNMNMNSGFGGGGFGGQQYADPWVQQVPDQGYGQAWDSVGNNSNSGGRGGGTWQGYGGQTFGNYNSGGFGRK